MGKTIYTVRNPFTGRQQSTDRSKNRRLTKKERTDIAKRLDSSGKLSDFQRSQLEKEGISVSQPTEQTTTQTVQTKATTSNGSTSSRTTTSTRTARTQARRESTTGLQYREAEFFLGRGGKASKFVTYEPVDVPPETTLKDISRGGRKPASGMLRQEVKFTPSELKKKERLEKGTGLSRVDYELKDFGGKVKDFKYIPAAVGVGVARFYVGAAKTLAHPIQTIKSLPKVAKTLVTNPQEIGYPLGKYIQERPAEFGGQVLGFMSVGALTKKATSKLATKSKSRFGDFELTGKFDKATKSRATQRQVISGAKAEFKGTGTTYIKLGKLKLGKRKFTDVIGTAEFKGGKLRFQSAYDISGKSGKIKTLYAGTGKGVTSKTGAIEVIEGVGRAGKQFRYSKHIRGTGIITAEKDMVGAFGTQTGVIKVAGKTTKVGKNLKLVKLKGSRTSQIAQDFGKGGSFSGFVSGGRYAVLKKINPSSVVTLTQSKGVIKTVGSTSKVSKVATIGSRIPRNIKVSSQVSGVGLYQPSVIVPIKVKSIAGSSGFTTSSGSGLKAMTGRVLLETPAKGKDIPLEGFALLGQASRISKASSRAKTIRSSSISSQRIIPNLSINQRQTTPERFKISPIVTPIQTPRQRQGGRQSPRQVLETVPETPPPTTPPIVPIVPVVPPVRLFSLDSGSLFSGKKGRRGRRTKSFTKYSPSIEANLFKIRGNKPKFITGLEIRPIKL